MPERLASDSLLVIRIPYRPDTVHYRAYAERLGDGSVLEWILSRFIAGKPPGVRMVCACTGESERIKVMEAVPSLAEPEVACVDGQSEPEFCQRLMKTYEATRLVMATFDNMIAPVALVRDVLRIHVATRAHLTDVQAPAFAKPLYVIESEMVDMLVAAGAVSGQLGVIEAATAFCQKRTPVSPEVRWQRVNASAMYGIEAARWPERVSMESSADVAILRETLARLTTQPAGNRLLDAWKQSATTIRALVAKREASEKHRQKTNDTRSRARVLYVSTLSHVVGASQSLCHLIDGMDRRRVEPFAIVPFEGVLTTELRRGDVTVISPNRELKTIDEEYRLVHRLIQDVSPDVVHANHTMGPLLVALTVAAGVPFVQDVRLANPDPFKMEIHTADAVIAVSQFVRQRIMALDVDPAKISVIFDSVDTERFAATPSKRRDARQRLGIPAHEFVIAIVARMTKQKRIETVVKAVGRMRRTLGRGYLLIAAPRDSDSGYYDYICGLIDREGMREHTTRFEYVSDVPSILHASDTLALLSVNEALGRVVVEGMAAGLAVVVGDSGGSKELIEQGTTGFVVRCGDVEGLASVLGDLALSPEHATAIGAAAAESISARFTNRQCAAQVMEIYERVLA